MSRTDTISFCKSIVYKTSIMYQFWVFTLFIQTGLSSFPTIYQADTVTVYKDLEKHEFVFEMDLFDFDLETFINGLSVTQKSDLRESLFQKFEIYIKNY